MACGILHGRTLRIDKSGRIVVPKAIRERLGLKPRMESEVLEQSGGVLLRPVEQRPPMVRVEGLWVRQGVAQPGTAWDRALEAMRKERIQSVLKANR
jgi:AbrB family looped-hinge helix DNA binding protein